MKLDSNRRVHAGAGKTLYTALLRGVPVVDVTWVQDSIAQEHLLPVESYLARVSIYAYICVCIVLRMFLFVCVSV